MPHAKPPPLQGKQSPRGIHITATAEEHAALLHLQAEHFALTGKTVPVGRLAKEAFQAGLRDDDGLLPGQEREPYDGPVYGGRQPVDTGALKRSLKVR